MCARLSSRRISDNCTWARVASTGEVCRQSRRRWRPPARALRPRPGTLGQVVPGRAGRRNSPRSPRRATYCGAVPRPVRRRPGTRRHVNAGTALAAQFQGLAELEGGGARIATSVFGIPGRHRIGISPACWRPPAAISMSHCAAARSGLLAKAVCRAVSRVRVCAQQCWRRPTTASPPPAF